LKKDNIKGEWKDFKEKIVYIYEKIFNSDKEKLILYFSDPFLSPQKQKSRKKTIENWLEGKTKKPNGFHLSKFKINEYEMNGELLLNLNAFKNWSIEMFKERIDTYIKEKSTNNTPNEMKYIYFFNVIEKTLSYFKITYPNAENDSIVHLSSPVYTANMTYKGTITTYNNMTYISVRNEFDYLHYIFKNNVNVYRKELKIFGVAQCVDAPTREPKSYLALLTSSKLTPDEKKKFVHKLNFSNLMIADDFSHGCQLEKDYFLENFSEKIYQLERDFELYNIKESLSEDFYFDIILKEYGSYIKLLEKALYHNDYPINHKRQSILFALEEMCQTQQEEVTIFYLLNAETLNILDSKNSIMEMQLKLVAQKKLLLTYLFIVEDLSLITKQILEKINYLEQHGINVKLTTNTHSIYSKILVVKNKNFAIYKRKNNQSDNQVSKNATTIEALNYEVEELIKNSISLQEFTQKHYPLNGVWYNYAYGSKKNDQHFQTVIFTINSSSLLAQFPNKIVKGQLLKLEEFTLILLEHSIIKIHNINLHDKIFRVSIIGKEKNMYHRDVLLFGLFAKEKLTEKQVKLLLKNIHQKEDEVFRLKISNDFDSILACFDINS